MFKEINIGGYVLRFYPTDNKGWMCGITDEQLTALMSITTLFTNPVKELTDEEMMKAEYEFMYWNRSLAKPLVEIAYELGVFKQAVAILRKAQEK